MYPALMQSRATEPSLHSQCNVVLAVGRALPSIIQLWRVTSHRPATGGSNLLLPLDKTTGFINNSCDLQFDSGEPGVGQHSPSMTDGATLTLGLTMGRAVGHPEEHCYHHLLGGAMTLPRVYGRPATLLSTKPITSSIRLAERQSGSFSGWTLLTPSRTIRHRCRGGWVWRSFWLPLVTTESPINKVQRSTRILIPDWRRSPIFGNKPAVDTIGAMCGPVRCCVRPIPLTNGR